MTRQEEDRRMNWAAKQVSDARRAEAAAKAVWVASPTTANWRAWQAAEDRTEAARSVSDKMVKQAVMQNDAMRAW